MFTPFLLVVGLALVGCATTRNNPAENSPSKEEKLAQGIAPLPTDSTPSPAPVEPSNGEWEPSPIPNDLRYAISRWIAENPDAEFEEIARQANRTLRQLGYPYRVDVAHLLKEKQEELVLRSENRKLVFRIDHEISRDRDLCGEQFLSLSALPKRGKTLWMISENRRIPVDLSRARWEQFRLFKDGKYLRTLASPEPTEPLGISPDGRSLYLRFPLHDRLVHDWWHRLGNQLSPLFDEEPFLVLRVSRNQLYFEENISNMLPQEFEVEKSRGSIFRWKFQPSGITLELNGHCRAS